MQEYTFHVLGVLLFGPLPPRPPRHSAHHATAVGPSVEGRPDYPTLRVGDLEVVGELGKPDEYDTYLNVRC